MLIYIVKTKDDLEILRTSSYKIANHYKGKKGYKIIPKKISGSYSKVYKDVV